MCAGGTKEKGKKVAKRWGRKETLLKAVCCTRPVRGTYVRDLVSSRQSGNSREALERQGELGTV